MSTADAASTGGHDHRPRRAGAPSLACGMLVWIMPEGASGPTFYEAKRLRPPKDRGIACSYSLARPGSTDRHIVGLGPDGPHCSCPDFAFNGQANGPRGCKHCRALSALGLL